MGIFGHYSQYINSNQYLSFTAGLEEAKLDTGESLSQIK